MSLTLCIECNSKISRQTVACPHCGAPVDQPADASEVAGVVALVVFGLPVLALVAGIIYLIS